MMEMPARVVGEEKVKIKKSFIKPWMGIKYLFKKPVTIKIPYEKIEPAPKYRGFHTLDWKKCVGCNFCGQICPARAIEMTWIEGEKRPHPKVDYGRCTFCQFCVDVCPTGALGFSENYYLTTGGLEEDLELYDWVPIDPKKMKELNEKFNDYRFPVERIQFNKETREVTYYLRDGSTIQFKILGYGLRPPKPPAKPAAKPAEKNETKPAEKKKEPKAEEKK
ncbi:NADH-quinone oxidoreductase subunit I [Thermococcus peptonophilus]|uniref:NADH-quinone oxidoreductase subunit I n=2 Tax=Thermococcus peptonophilus TaxID=53952 RepID=A0A142CWW0_9EURY|nr:NADH-quinone oxidoreductase subunit I [Thermococcus peptonophilus]